LRKRAALWTIGHIGSSEYGFKLIQEADILKIIVDLAENAEILSIRGLVIEILFFILERQYMSLD
jgi:rapamycin-insensitive companion of mTOR